MHDDAALEETARRLTGEERRRVILAQIEGCLGELVGGSGDLGRFLLLEGSLKVSEERALEDGGVEANFSARAYLETERLPGPDDGPVPVSGRLALDAALRTRAGPDGGTALSPYTTTVPPATWTPPARRALSRLARE